MFIYNGMLRLTASFILRVSNFFFVSGNAIDQGFSSLFVGAVSSSSCSVH